VYKSITNGADIPYPRQGDQVAGGHAVMAVGYDDNHRTAGGEDEPSLIIRNSWGTGWGDAGYGYLPYRYVLEGLAQDFWAVFQWNWIDQGQFG
jgi:C1A family cysteine protease